MFEVYCLDTYFDRVDEKTVRSFYDQFQNYDKLEQETYEKLDIQLHRMFVDISHNKILTDTYERLNAMFSLGYFLRTEKIDVANEEHLRILEAVQKNDRKTAVEELKLHLDRVREEVTDYYHDTKEEK